jgi:hypothetical protein
MKPVYRLWTFYAAILEDPDPSYLRCVATAVTRDEAKVKIEAALQGYERKVWIVDDNLSDADFIDKTEKPEPDDMSLHHLTLCSKVADVVRA